MHILLYLCSLTNAQLDTMSMAQLDAMGECEPGTSEAAHAALLLLIG